MIATIWPGATACAAGAVTWASTLPTATGDALGQAGPGRGLARSGGRRRSPSWPIGVVELVVDEAGEAGVERGEEVAARVGAVLVDALVAGGAGVAHVASPHSCQTIQSAASTQWSIAA